MYVQFEIHEIEKVWNIELKLREYKFFKHWCSGDRTVYRRLFTNNIEVSHKILFTDDDVNITRK